MLRRPDNFTLRDLFSENMCIGSARFNELNETLCGLSRQKNDVRSLADLKVPGVAMETTRL
jgi:hypothetical protein